LSSDVDLQDSVTFGPSDQETLAMVTKGSW